MNPNSSYNTDPGRGRGAPSFNVQSAPFVPPSSYSQPEDFPPIPRSNQPYSRGYQHQPSSSLPQSTIQSFDPAAAVFVPPSQRGRGVGYTQYDNQAQQQYGGYYAAVTRAQRGQQVPPPNAGRGGMSMPLMASSSMSNSAIPYTPQYPPSTLPSNVHVLPGRRTIHSFFMNDNLRQHYQKRTAQILRGTSLDEPSSSNYPSRVGQFHSFFPLETSAPRVSQVLGVPSTVIKCINVRDGLPYALRKIDGPIRTANEVVVHIVELWKQIQHSGIVSLRDVFRSSQLDTVKQSTSLFFVYDFHPLSETLESKYLKPGSPFIQEEVLWSIIAQLAAAIQHVHRHRLFFSKVLSPSKILVTGKNRVRVNCVGIEDALQLEPVRPLAQAQYHDLIYLGRLVVILASRNRDGMANFAKSMEFITNNYSPAVKDLIVTLSNKPTTAYPSIDDIMMMIYPHFVDLTDRLFSHTDNLEAELAKECDNGRIVRLMAKINFITERPDNDASTAWSETGDRYVIKLFRDYVFHQVNEQGQAVLDFAHVIECLNKLDVGSPERILLMSRNEKSMLIVTYADIKRLVEEAFEELCKQNTSAAASAAGNSEPMGLYPNPNAVPFVPMGHVMRIIKNRAPPANNSNPDATGNSSSLVLEVSSSQTDAPDISSSSKQDEISSAELDKTSKKRNRDGSPVHKTRLGDDPSVFEGYNSEDEYPSADKSPKALDEEALRHVSPSSLYRALKKKGFQVVETALDGNCLFRAVADQVYGDMEMHSEIRRLCMDYMEKERDHYSQFVTEDFREYLARKRQDGVFGNHLELQAIAEMYNRPVYIYTTDERPLNLFQGMYDASNNPPIRLSYHYGNHYNSVRDPESPSVGVGLGLPGFNAEAFNKAEKALMKQVLLKSDEALLEEEMLRSVLRQSELDDLEEALAAQFYAFDETLKPEKRKSSRSPSRSPKSDRGKSPSSPKK